MVVQKPQRETIKRYIRDCSLAQEAQEEDLRQVSAAIDALVQDRASTPFPPHI